MSDLPVLEDLATGETLEATIIEIGETSGLLAEEAAVVVFAPEVAAAGTLAYISAKIWEHFGDRIAKGIEKLPKHIYNRMKDYVTGTDRPRKQPGRHVGEKDKYEQQKLPYRSKKIPNRTERERSPVNAERDLEEKNDAQENPPPAKAGTVIPQMGKWTSFPNTATCVDLGTMELDPKGGPGGDRILESDLVGIWTQWREMYQYACTSGDDGRFFQLLSESEVVMSQEDSQTTPADIGGDSSSQVHKYRTKFSKTANYRNCSFNSCLIIHEVLENMPVDKMGTQMTFVYPVPEGQTYEDQFFQTNDAYMNIGIKNQYIELHIKNASKSTLDTDINSPVTAAAPAKVTLRVVQAKEDIPVNADNDGTISNHFNTDVAAGWTRTFDRSRTDSPIVPTASNSQNYLMRYSDNGYLSEYWDIIDKKEFCLCPGQEGTLKIGLPKKQIISCQYMLNARKGTLLSGSVGSTAVWRYKTPYIKKGEQHVLLELHGGVGFAYDGATVTNHSVNISPAQVAIVWTHSYEYCVVSTNTTQKAIKTNNVTKTKYTNYTQDPDVSNAVVA